MTRPATMMYAACVAMAQVTNSDQPGFDLASAMAAVDAMVADGLTEGQVFVRLSDDVARLMRGVT